MVSPKVDEMTATAEEIVRAEIAAWSTNDVETVMSHFAENATFDIGPDWPKLQGRAAIHEMMKTFFAGGKCVDLKVLHLAVDGNVVLMERTDYWVVDGKQMSWPVMGAYEVKDGKITAWREYFSPPTAA
jgi:limonene-1,2-epoxide hydrolase